MSWRVTIIVPITLIYVLYGSTTTAQHLVKYNTYLRSDAGTDTMWDGRVLRIYGIASKLSADPHIPANTLYCNEGDTLDLHTRSISQGDHHTIHLHGLDATTPNDGDPATSFWLNHQQDTDYTVIAAHAGTYLYHCHVADVLHVQMGMYGMIVVRPADGSQHTWTGGPSFDRSYNWLFSEIDPVWHDSIPKHDPVADTVHIPPYVPTYFLVNGKSESQFQLDTAIAITAVVGEKLYIRVAAIGFFYQRVRFPSWMRARIVDSDGRPLDEAIVSDTLVCAPGERYGVLLDALSAQKDRIDIQYVNMNTDSVWSTQHVPVTINGQWVTHTDHHAPLLSVFPNPTGTSLSISVEGLQQVESTIRIFNEQGTLVYRSAAILPLQIDTHMLAAGAYTIVVSSAGQEMHTTCRILH